MLLPQVFNCNWHNFHWDCFIHSAVLPPCALFMKWPMYFSTLLRDVFNERKETGSIIVNIPVPYVTNIRVLFPSSSFYMQLCSILNYSLLCYARYIIWIVFHMRSCRSKCLLCIYFISFTYFLTVKEWGAHPKSYFEVYIKWALCFKGTNQTV